MGQDDQLGQFSRWFDRQRMELVHWPEINGVIIRISPMKIPKEKKHTRSTEWVWVCWLMPTVWATDGAAYAVATGAAYAVAKKSPNPLPK